MCISTEFDAFTQGISVGGMRTKNDIRILLCYILKTINEPISKTQLDTLFTTTELANFFEVGDALAQLKASDVVNVVSDEAGEDFYSLTPAGRDASDNLETDVPVSTRKKAVSAAMEILAREKNKRYTEAKIEKLNRGYNVMLSIKDGDTVMMQTVLYAADSLQANVLCDNFTADPSKLYGGIIELLTS